MSTAAGVAGFGLFRSEVASASIGSGTGSASQNMDGSISYRDNYTYSPPAQLGHATWGAASSYDVDMFDDVASGYAFAGTRPAQTDADHTVTNQQELLDAMDTASDGDLIFVPGDTTINLDGVQRQDVNAPNVTLASDRGTSSRGAVLEVPDGSALSSRRRWVFEITQPGFRLTGLRLYGNQTTHNEWVSYEENDPMVGVTLRADDCEIDNIVGRGWGYAVIYCFDDNSEAQATGIHVHHCDLVDNPQDALGYGLSVNQAYPLIQYNYFDNNRHSIAAAGNADCSYICRNNLFGQYGVYHAIDMHDPGGDRIFIYDNLVLFDADTVSGSGKQEAVKIRGIPTIAEVYDNQFAHPWSRYTKTGPGSDGYAVLLETSNGENFEQAGISVYSNRLMG